MRLLTKLSAAGLLSLSAVATMAAQTSGTINARATVRSPITIVNGRDLDFGIVIQNVNKTVAETDPTSSGRFDATGTANANVNVNFTLPANLINGANNLAIGTWTGCYNQTAASNGAGCTTIANMAGTTATSFGNVAGTGRLWVFVGATVSPTAAQAVGNYTNTVTLTLTYF